MLVPRVGYRGIVGGVRKIWWAMVYWRRFAVTVEEDGLGRRYWILWYHRDEVWVHQIFLEECRTEVVYWVSFSGHVRGVAIGLNSHGMHMMMEVLEEQSQSIWLLHMELDRAVSGKQEYQTVFALRTALRPNWETFDV